MSTPSLEAEPDSELSQQARSLLEVGKLQEAGTAYEALIKAAEARRDVESARIASYSLDRGRILWLDFRPLQARHSGAFGSPLAALAGYSGGALVS
jgi:hypothetical protein